MHPVDEIIFNRFRIRRYDNVPYTGRRASREVLALVFAEAGYKYGAEVGVRHGVYSQLMCEANPGVKLLCIDPWAPYRANTAERMEATYQGCKERLAKYDVTLIRKTSMDAVKDIPDNSLDFVYIDAMHEFDPVMMDIIHWAPKVRPGGIVSGHDYCWYYQGGVVEAVNAYTRCHDIQTWYLTQRDKLPSWLWVR